MLSPAPMVLDYEPTFKASAVFTAPVLALPAPYAVPAAARAIVPPVAGKPRVRARVDEGTSFADFLAARKKQNAGGSGRPAAAPVRRVSRADAEAALKTGASAMRAIYAWCYGFETKSGNLAWLRQKVTEAIGDEEKSDE